MAQEFWVKVQADGEEYGPYTAQQLREYAAAGQVAPQSLVSLDHATWHPAGRIKNLFPPAEQAPLPPASPSQRAPAVAARAAQRANIAPVTAVPHAAHAVPMASPPARNAPIAYRSTTTAQSGLTPDEQFRGVFLLLYITALVLGLLFLLAGIALALVALQMAGRHAGEISYTGLAVPAAVMLSGAFLAAAGLLGLVRKRAEGLLFIGALIFAIVRVAGTIMDLNQDSFANARVVHNSWAFANEIPRLILALSFPVLCFVGIAAVRRARQSPAASDARSPWAPLARAIGIIAMVAGAFMLVRYGRVAVNLSGSIGKISPQVTAIRKEALLRTAFALLMSAGMVVSGALTLLGNLVGRIILLASSVGLLLYVIYLASRYITMLMKGISISDHFVDVTPLFLFVLFAAIVLLRGGLSKARSA